MLQAKPADSPPPQSEQLARERLMRYLEALALPPAKAQRLCAQALAIARAEPQQALLPAALLALQTLLEEAELPEQPGARPIRRQSMVPEPLERGLPRMSGLALVALARQLDR